MRFLRVSPLLALALCCLAFTAAPDEYSALCKTAAVVPLAAPVDPVYRPATQHLEMTSASRTDAGDAATVFAMTRETTPAADGALSVVERTESITSGTRMVKEDRPLIVMSWTMTPKGQDLGHELALPGLESKGQGRNTPFGQTTARNLESLLTAMALPDKPVGQGDVLLSLPASTFLGAGATQTAGSTELVLRVDGRGVLDGREVLAVSGSGKLTFTVPQSPQAPQAHYEMELFVYRLYDLKTMAQLRAGSSTRVSTQGRTFLGSMSLVSKDIK